MNIFVCRCLYDPLVFCFLIDLFEYTELFLKELWLDLTQYTDTGSYTVHLSTSLERAHK